MPFHYRRRIRLGPLPIFLNFTKRGVSSLSIKIWAWSWNSRTRRNRVDLPGGASWTEGDDR